MISLLTIAEAAEFKSLVSTYSTIRALQNQTLAAFLTVCRRQELHKTALLLHKICTKNLRSHALRAGYQHGLTVSTWASEGAKKLSYIHK